MRQEPVALPYFSRTGLRQAFSTRHGPLLPVSPGPEPARAPPPSLRLQPDLILHSEAAVAPLPPSPPPQCADLRIGSPAGCPHPPPSGPLLPLMNVLRGHPLRPSSFSPFWIHQSRADIEILLLLSSHTARSHLSTLSPSPHCCSSFSWLSAGLPRPPLHRSCSWQRQ